MKVCKLVLMLILLLTAASGLAQDPVPAGDAATDPDPATPAGDPAAGEAWTDAGESGAALPEMVVEAQNEVRQSIDKGAFEFELDAAAVDSFYSAMDEEALAVSPVSGLQPHLNNLEPLRSDQPPHPWLPEIPTTPVASFYTEEPEGHQTRRWELAITDFRGSPCRTYEGSGEPPEQVHWDGRSDQGEMLRVGYPYSYVFTTTDKGTNSYNYAGESFRLPALDYRHQGDRILELAGGELFARRQSELTTRGERWLTRTADEIRRHPYSPVRVVVVAEAEDLAVARARHVAAYLADSMIVPREQIETEGEQKPDLRAEMDGTVRVVIEHAD
jgi:outer membrane protein OmpA-like peptidoglycan-associated protein